MRFSLARVGRRIAAAGLIAAFVAAFATAMPHAAIAQSATDASGVGSTYTINTGDEIEVYVWGEERLQRVLHVLPDGTVAFPLVGQIRVQGLLPAAVEKLISEKLKPQYRGDVPNVTVSVRNPAGLQFSVMGKVRSPGSFTPGRYINVIDAVSMAGGPAEFANLDNVSIIRRQGDHQVTLHVRLSGIFKGNAPGTIDKGTAVPLLPGDIVIVP